MLQIVWSRAALDDLERISRFVAQHDERAAEQLQARIEESVLPVAHYPHLFRSGRLPTLGKSSRIRTTSSSIEFSRRASGY